MVYGQLPFGVRPSPEQLLPGAAGTDAAGIHARDIGARRHADDGQEQRDVVEQEAV